MVASPPVQLTSIALLNSPSTMTAVYTLGTYKQAAHQISAIAEPVTVFLQSRDKQLTGQRIELTARLTRSSLAG